MPWLLNHGVADEREVSWSEVYREDGTKATPPMWHRPDNVPDAKFWPLPFKQTSRHTEIPDFCRGRGQGTLFVSSALRALIEKMDPVAHHFVPLRLELWSGAIIEGEYFLFKFGDFVDGIIAENSEVGPMLDSSGKLGFYSAGYSSKIIWRSEAISGRHFWTDTYLRNRYFCSDEFLRELKSRNMGVFDAIESFIQ